MFKNKPGAMVRETFPMWSQRGNSGANLSQSQVFLFPNLKNCQYLKETAKQCLMHKKRMASSRECVHDGIQFHTG